MMFFDLSQRSNRKTDTHSEAYREAALALRHLRREMKGAFDVTLADERLPKRYFLVKYTVPLWKDGRIVVDHRGLPLSGGDRVIRFFGGKLERHDVAPASDYADQRNWSNPRVLATLAENGSLLEPKDLGFEELSSERVLTAHVTVIKRGAFRNEGNYSRQKLTLAIGLPNRQYWTEEPILKW